MRWSVFLIAACCFCLEELVGSVSLGGLRVMGSVFPRLRSLTQRHPSARPEDVITEAVSYLEEVFIDRHKFSKIKWMEICEELRNMTLPAVQALQHLSAKLDDPYFRVLSKADLESEQHRLHGVRIGVGISLRRQLSFRHTLRGLFSLFVPSLATSHSRDSFVKALAEQGLNGISVLLLALSPALPAKMALNKVVAGACSLNLLLKLSPYLFPAEVTSVHEPSQGVLEVGDIIVGVGGRALPPISAQATLAKIDHGKLDDVVKLRILRAGSAEIKSINVTRTYVDSPKVEFRLLSRGKDHTVGYVHIREFSTTCLQDCKGALLSLNAESAKTNSTMQGLVIDLRDNLGGAMLSGLELASLFTPYNALLLRVRVNGKEQLLRNVHGLTALYEESFSPSRVASWIQHGRTMWKWRPLPHSIGLYASLPLLLLVNQNTASASEIFVQSVRSHHPSVQTMGCRTVGKNKAQAMIKLADGTGLIFSICEFLSPDGRNMGSGHIPDVEVKDECVSADGLCFDPSDQSWTHRPSLR